MATKWISVLPWEGARGFAIGVYFKRGDLPLIVLTVWKWIVSFGKQYHRPQKRERDQC